jgi:hypothetical protein
MVSQNVRLQAPSDIMPHPRGTKTSKLIHFYSSENELFNLDRNSLSVYRLINEFYIFHSMHYNTISVILMSKCTQLSIDSQ